MGKEKFLEELKDCLQILEDQEQQDIIEEYAQHIDMKLQKGLSEEEAIRDFGPIRELAAQILEAYHVKPEYEEKKQKQKSPDLSGMAERGKRIRSTLGRFFKEKARAAGHGIRRFFLWIGRQGKALRGVLAKPFRKKTVMAEGNGTGRNAEERGGEDVQERPVKESTEKKAVLKGSELARGAGRTLGAAWKCILSVCRWGLCLMWNISWLLMALFMGGLALITLAGLGAMLILLFQGYPIAGIFLVTLGGMLCLGAFSCGCFSLLIRKRDPKDRQPRSMDLSGEEVRYE